MLKVPSAATFALVLFICVAAYIGESPVLAFPLGIWSLSPFLPARRLSPTVVVSSPFLFPDLHVWSLEHHTSLVVTTFLTAIMGLIHCGGLVAHDG